MRKRASQLFGESLRDQRGISPVVGAILVISIVSLSMSVYLQQVVPVHQRRNEAAHMNEVRSLFLELQSMILNRESGELDFPMTPEPSPIFSAPPLASTIEVRPALWTKRFMPTADAYVDQANPGVNYGSSEVLSVQSYANANRWIYLTFDLPGELPGVDSESIEEAWLVLYCESISKFLAWPWETNPAEFSEFDEFYLPDFPVNVEVRKVTESWDEGTVNWSNRPAEGETIKAIRWPYADNHTIKDNEAWFTWDVTSWIRERAEAGEPVSFCLKPSRENSTQPRYANFSSKERGALDVVEPPEVEPTSEFPYYEDEKTTGHPPYLKPHLLVVYENGDEPGPPTSDNWGPLIEDGYIKLELHTYRFPEHSFILESGAVLQQQWVGAYTMMISHPGLILGEHVDDEDAIVVTINRYRIVNRDRINTSSDVRLRVRVWENTDFRIEPTDEDGDGDPDPNRENLMITIVSSHEWQWKRYLRDLTSQWNVTYSKGGLQAMVDYYYGQNPNPAQDSVWSANIADFMAKLYVDLNTRVYIWGRIEDPSIKDIYYYDYTYDVEVTIGV